MSNTVKANILVSYNGAPDEQRSGIVSFIEDSFTDPEKWPITDEGRIAFIKQLWTKVQRLRATERAVEAAGRKP